jgi:hypothetical protein
MHFVCLLVALLLVALLLPVGPVGAQTTDRDRLPPQQGAACPPDVRGNPPTVGGGSSQPLSERLAESKGVICPPAAVDPEMQVPPPAGGQLKVIPPPGTPGGDPSVQPK